MTRNNYSYKKYQKELAKKKKAEEKKLRKLERKNLQANEQLALSSGATDPISASDESADATGEG